MGISDRVRRRHVNKGQGEEGIRRKRDRMENRHGNRERVRRRHGNKGQGEEGIRGKRDRVKCRLRKDGHSDEEIVCTVKKV